MKHIKYSWIILLSLLFSACNSSTDNNNIADNLSEKVMDETYKEVDLGLSVKWADCNVGASEPEEVGLFFAWGDTEGHDEHFIYNDTYEGPYYWDKDGYKTERETEIAGTCFDAARKYMGSGWRMPTKEECRELWEKCKWENTTKRGKKGYRIFGPNGNSIFMPSFSIYSETWKADVYNMWIWMSSSNTSKSWISPYYLCSEGRRYGDFREGLQVRGVKAK